MEAQVSVVGLDIAKSVSQVHAADSVGKAIIRRRLKREEVEIFFRKFPPSLVALEACPGSHFGARLLRDIGHDVRLLPPQYVRPYVKTNKSDAADAEAICEAVTRPTMRFVPIKEEMQQEVLVLWPAAGFSDTELG
ncbi:transposase [Rhizobium lentis]|nr:transposase [Rhizobium lentis]MBB4577569.1 transposase [Rhizobium lentis]MBB5554124.1 transposase [Rhizobium lentis]MBB5571246.1 transposase [Rhizobium lentis]